MTRFQHLCAAGAHAVRLAFGLLICLAAGVAPAADQDYRLGAGDTLRISVFQNPDLTLETRLSESGDITYPLLGQVRLGGLTVAEAEGRIAGGLRDGGFVLQPQVNVLLTEVRGNQVSVLGLVGRPGRFPLEGGRSRLTDVLAQAGGVQAQGADTVVINGQRDGKAYRAEINVPALLMSADGQDNPALQNGDVVYVHRAPVFYIYGEVQRPGAFRVEPKMSVMQALALGGGLTVRGTTRGLRLNRRDDGGAVQSVEPRLDDLVLANDVLVIQESLF